MFYFLSDLPEDVIPVTTGLPRVIPTGLDIEPSQPSQDAGQFSPSPSPPSSLTHLATYPENAFEIPEFPDIERAGEEPAGPEMSLEGGLPDVFDECGLFSYLSFSLLTRLLLL
jgi:hypothetical protein